MSPRPGALGTLAAAQLVITARLACPPVTTPLRSLVAGPSRLPWSPPPSGPRLQTRTLFTRATSFWAPSYPPPTNDQSWVPAIPPRPGADLSPPPLPAPSPVTQENIAPSDGRRSRIKERYLDSLMDKAGELGLQCRQ
jgi:magnesium transporter